MLKANGLGKRSACSIPIMTFKPFTQKIEDLYYVHVDTIILSDVSMVCYPCSE